VAYTQSLKCLYCSILFSITSCFLYPIYVWLPHCLWQFNVTVLKLILIYALSFLLCCFICTLYLCVLRCCARCFSCYGCMHILFICVCVPFIAARSCKIPIFNCSLFYQVYILTAWSCVALALCLAFSFFKQLIKYPVGCCNTFVR
jgi:hypothetical protein